MKTLAIMGIPLTQGLFALVDGEDYEEISKCKWSANKIGNTYYAVRSVSKRPNQRTILMHRQILNAQVGEDVDHREHYGLDNRKQNIRLCTRSQNNQNQKPYENKSSKFKGVSWSKIHKKWRAQIQHNNKHIHLGLFDDEVEAGKAYDKAAREIFSEFARTNFGD